ncbi:MAG: MinD/ParA family protein [Smithella sp.]|nr:MinD/ParA family protein [Smithella sp.]
MQHSAFDNPDRRGTTVLAITSGKGGVGKTNIAANLSICLADEHRRVLLMDADLGLGNLDVILNIQSRYNLSHVVSGRRHLEEIVHLGPSGVEVICGGSGIELLANLNTFQRQRLIDELDTLHDRSDFLVIDTGAGIQSSVVGFCLASNETLVVTTPEPTAMTDAYAMIKVLAANGYAGRISLLVNMARSVGEGRTVYRQISDVASRFLDTPVYEAGVLYRDEAVVNAVRQRTPVLKAYPKSPFSTAMNEIGRRLTQASYQNARSDGFFRKVVNWFF